MSYKIAFIGGGSVLWTPRLSCDLFLEPSLRGSELYLVDIDRNATKLTKSYLESADKFIGNEWKIFDSDMDSALKDADCVIVSISTGGFEAMHLDYTIPEKYGVFHTVSDTVGPGGIARSIRNIPVFIDIARKMEKLCPDSYMLHVTNPLSQITRAVNKAANIKCVGMCHEYTGIIKMLQNFFKIDNDNDLDSLCIGVNHFTVMENLKVKGIPDAMDRLSLKNYLEYEMRQDGTFKTGTTDDEVAKLIASSEKLCPYYFNFYLYEKLGVFPVSGTNHFCENIPFFNNNEDTLKEYHLHRKGVLPNRPDRKKERTGWLTEALEKGEQPVESKQRSNEMLCDAVVGLLTGEPRRIIAAMPNIGQIDDLPRDVAVETWAVASRSGVNPVASGNVPSPYKGFMEQIIEEQELTVEAGLTGDKTKLVQAMFVSPELHRKDMATELAMELLGAHKQYLPQFK